MSKCPYCFRPIGTHTHDPIILPNGAKYKWSDSTEITLIEESDIAKRIYKGFQQITEDEVIELQEELKTLETENGVTPLTEFSPLNSTGKFQITGKHIKEMRDSVEKILDTIGQTKTQFFNYDEDGNHIIHPLGDKLNWTDPITNAIDLQKFQVKYIHIEDLRHYIQTIWQETWSDFSFSDSCNIDGEGTSEELKTGVLNADYDWDYNLSWTENALKAIGSSVAGSNYFKADAILSCSNNYSFSGYSEAVALGFASQGTATSFHGIVHNTNQAIVPVTNNKLNLVINNLNYSYTRNATGEGGDLPKIPTLIIRVRMGGDIYYVFGAEDYYPLTYKILITSSAYSGNFQRNLYDDFFTLYGVYPSLKVAQIRIYTRTDSQCGSSAFFETPRWGQNASVEVSLEEIQLRNIG